MTTKKDNCNKYPSAIPVVKADPSDWMKPTFHLENRTAEQVTAEEKEQQEFLARLRENINPTPKPEVTELDILQQLQLAREKTQEAAATRTSTTATTTNRRTGSLAARAEDHRSSTNKDT